MDREANNPSVPHRNLLGCILLCCYLRLLRLLHIRSATAATCGADGSLTSIGFARQTQIRPSDAMPSQLCCRCHVAALPGAAGQKVLIRAIYL